MGTLTSRLWAKIAKGDPTACWPWTAYRDQDGYGRLRVGGTNRPAHALVLEEATGELADGRVAQHSCDNPSCCNPDHLSWGTHASNHADRNAKKRQARGERQGSARLTNEQVIAIRARHVRKCSTHGTLAIAREYGVNKNTIDRIISGQSWQV